MDERHSQFEADIVTIPLRAAKVLVRIQGIPWDLSRAEADKLIAVIQAYAAAIRNPAR